MGEGVLYFRLAGVPDDVCESPLIVSHYAQKSHMILSVTLHTVLSVLHQVPLSHRSFLGVW